MAAQTLPSYEFDSKQLEKTKNILILGTVGAGKTTIFNKLTGCNKPTQGAISVTRFSEYAPARAALGDYMVIDTPGLDSGLNVFEHRTEILRTLHTIPVWAVILATPITKRADSILSILNPFMEMFFNHVDSVCFWITFTDDLEENRLSDFGTALNKTKLNTNDYMYSGENSDAQSILQSLKSIIEKDSFSLIESFRVPEYFISLFVPKIESIGMKTIVGKSKAKFEKILKAFDAVLQNSNDDELKRGLYLTLKDQKDVVVKELYDEIDVNSSFTLDEECKAIFDFEDFAYQLLLAFRTKAFSSFKLQKNYKNEANSLRKCPHCGLIWFKVTGCNSVRCGNRSIAPDHVVGSFQDYQIHVKLQPSGDFLVQYEKKEHKGLSTSYSDREFWGKADTDNPTAKPLGCGKNFVWSDAALADDDFCKSIRSVPITDFGAGIVYAKLRQKEKSQKKD